MSLNKGGNKYLEALNQPLPWEARAGEAQVHLGT